MKVRTTTRTRTTSSPSSPPTTTEDLAFNRNLERATEGLNDYVRKHLLEKISRENASIIVDYILAMHVEIRVSNNYRLNTIVTLKCLAESVVKKRSSSFKDMERQDIIDFLNTYRKSDEQDPMHKWIGTYNQIFARLAKFFKWLYYPDVPPNKRPEPPVIQNIGRLKRLEDQTYNDSQVWTVEDDILFLKYCPSKRDRCFHMMARDAACRPDELLKLKLKDVVLTQDAKQQWYAEILVTGKTGAKIMPLFQGVPYYKTWIADHPVKGNPDAPLFCAMQNKRNFGRRLSKGAMYRIYAETYKKQYFTKLAAPLVEEGGDPTVPEEDKQKLRVLLKKPWNPYLVHRHSTLTEVSERGGIGDSELFDQLAGWKSGSPMRRKYIHLKPNSGARALLKLRGVKFETDEEEQQAAKNRNALRPNTCYDCNEVNEPSAKSCVKCGFIFKFDRYKATTEEGEETKRRLVQLEAQQQERFKEMEEKVESLRKIALKQAFRVIEKEVEANPIPYIEGADKMTAQEVLFEMKKRGCNTWEG